MRLISLNTWGGKYFEPLINFIKQHSKDIDIFCFQEIYDTDSNIKQYKNIIRSNLLIELKNILTDFQVFYFPTLFGFDDEANKVDFNLSHGPAIFIKKSIKVAFHQNYFIYRDKSLYNIKKNFSNLATPLQHIKFNVASKLFSIFNFHGIPYPAAKKDTAKRLVQSKKTKRIIDKVKGGKILVGDFNLSLHTKSIEIFETDMTNLIKKFNIQRTRSRLSPYYGKRNFQKFADFTFVSSDVKVIDFQVPEVEISDHLPMMLEFS